MLRFLFWFLQKVINVNYKILNFLWKIHVRFDAFVEGFWLSFLSEDRFVKSIADFYKRNKKYTNDEQTLSGFFAWEKSIADNIPFENPKIVVLGAGGGRECLALNQMGYDVSAYESDEKMVSYAQRFFSSRKLEIPFSHIPFNTIPDEKCDIFWFGWGMYTHIIGRERRVDLLKRAGKQIPENGYVIISYWAENRDEYRVKMIEKTIQRLNRRKVEKGVGFRNGLWSKRYTPEQINEEADLAGLKVVHVSEVEYGHAILSNKEYLPLN